jgi:hypothetical protein
MPPLFTEKVLEALVKSTGDGKPYRPYTVLLISLTLLPETTNGPTDTPSALKDAVADKDVAVALIHKHL